MTHRCQPLFDSNDAGMLEKVIDMPVTTLFTPQVAGDPGLESVHGAARVNVPSRTEIERPQPSDPDPDRTLEPDQELVYSAIRIWGHRNWGQTTEGVEFFLDNTGGQSFIVGFMTRPRRINLPFTLYHVMSRTNSGDLSFLDQRDYLKFLHYLRKYTDLFSLRIHAYCLMSNHFHLLVEVLNRPELSEFMRRLLTAYTVYFNRRHGRHGHLFQGRFKSIVVEKADYLLALSLYIHTNPSRANENLSAETYKWSSLKYYIQGDEPEFLYTTEILHWFKGNRDKYAGFIREGMNEVTKPEIVQQRYIGGKSFVYRMNRRMAMMRKGASKAAKSMKKVAMEQEKSDLERANDLLKKVANHLRLKPGDIRNRRFGQRNVGKARTLVICLLRESLPWSYMKITEFMNLRDKSIVNYHEKRLRESQELQKILNNIKNPPTGQKEGRNGVRLPKALKK